MGLRCDGRARSQLGTVLYLRASRHASDSSRIQGTPDRQTPASLQRASTRSITSVSSTNRGERELRKHHIG